MPTEEELEQRITDPLDNTEKELTEARAAIHRTDLPNEIKKGGERK